MNLKQLFMPLTGLALIWLTSPGYTVIIRPVATRGNHFVIAALITAGMLLTSARPANATWQHDHGDSTNTGFARIDTDPAASPKQFAQLGPLAPGANPVIGPDGRSASSRAPFVQVPVP
jgi:hypothetical protein